MPNVASTPPRKTALAPERRDALRMIFAAIVDYHTSLVQTRFAIAALYLAATGFLASSWFNGATGQRSSVLIPILGMFFTLVCWGLEIRTVQLMRNLARKGMAVERLLGLRRGFFALMRKQPFAARLPFRGPEIRPWLSHTLSLNALYAATSAFWFVVLEWRALDWWFFGT